MRAAGWVFSALVLGGGAYLLTRGGGAGTSAPHPKCPLDKGKLNIWLLARNYFGFYWKSCPPPPRGEVAKTVPNIKTVPAGVGVVAICEDTGDFYLYNSSGLPVKRDDLRDSYCAGAKNIVSGVPSTWLP